MEGLTKKGSLTYSYRAVQPQKYGEEKEMKYLRFALIPAVLLLLPGLAQA
jgi:hypothetical protein